MVEVSLRLLPFAMATASGRQALVERYRREPAAGAQALFLEVVARSLNERQTLIVGSSAADLVDAAGLVGVQAGVRSCWRTASTRSVEVRRLTRKSSVRPHGRGITARSVQAIARGTRERMIEELVHLPGERHVGAGRDYPPCAASAGAELLALEHFYVVVSSGRRGQGAARFRRMVAGGDQR